MQPGPEAGQPKIHSPAREKQSLRSELRAARTLREEDPAAHSARTIRALAACAGTAVVACYASCPKEPDTAELLEALWKSDIRVLLPVLTPSPNWAWYSGSESMATGPFNIPQPTTARLGASALAMADWIWLPGLAGTTTGLRLGTGGGWYDRALEHARTDAVRGLLLFDDEVREELPTESWDQPVDLLVTERRRIDCPRGIPTGVSEL
jgi:5-formyltetrahydrofolate cyclo-ligase